MQEPLNDDSPVMPWLVELINGLIMLREKGSVYVENWKRETDYAMKVVQEIAKILKNCEEFVAKKHMGPDN